jgi:hypothetical protein
MPTYCYKNEETGEVQQLTMSVDEMCHLQTGEHISIDGVQWRRDYDSEGKTRVSTSKGWPITSEALGTHPSEVKNLQKELQGLGCGKVQFTKDGAMKLESHTQRRKILKAMNKQDKYGYD